MEFITIEKFREQPKAIQEVFLDWWECDYGDLYYYNEDLLEYKDVEIIDNNLECDLNGDFKYFKSIGPIPLFTEGQLRKFIEEKTEGILVASCNVIGSRLISIVKKDEILGGVKTIRRTHFGEGIDLLEAYWRLACRIAKEEVDG